MAKLDIFRFFALVRAILPRALMVGSDTAAIGGPPGEHPRAMSFLYLGVRHSGRPPRGWQPHFQRCAAQSEQIEVFSVGGVEDVRSGLDLTGRSSSKYDLERNLSPQAVHVLHPIKRSVAGQNYCDVLVPDSVTSHLA